ncbi:hypothetical protein [Kitasatospora sp. NPDC093806]|uniref:hypothetical protein n=1 Tax=Kitasatospora sp. NPDC093806 TaxID=3155075 RepID=UPI00341F4D9C
MTSTRSARPRTTLAVRSLTTALLAAGLWLPAAPHAAAAPQDAAAPTVDVTCPVGTATVSYSPGVTLDPKPTDLSFAGSAAPCTSTDPTITAANSVTGTGSGRLGCVSGSFDATGTITWNTGATSQVRFASVVDLRPSGIPVVVGNGPVTDGKFKGDAFTITIELLPDNPFLCFSTGVTQTHGAAAVTVTHA